MSTNTIKRFDRRSMLKGAGATLASSAILLQNPLNVWASTPSLQTYTQTQVLLGTFVTITTYHQSKTLAEEAVGHAFTEMKKLESELTRHDSAAPLAMLNTTGKLFDAPKSLVHVLGRAQRINSITEGAFDMTVAPLLGLYKQAQNPKGAINLNQQDLAHAQDLVQAKEVFIGLDHVRLGRQGMALTLDGIAKGYIADVASEVLTKYGVVNHLVNAGGDIRTSGQKNNQSPWRVAIENPTGNGQTIASIPVYGAIATSGSYEVFYDAKREYHHLIDPKHKQSPQHTVSVTVTAPTTLEADSLATALSVLPVRKALSLIHSLPKRECLIVTSQGQILKSNGWKSV